MIKYKSYTHKVPPDFEGKARLRNYIIGIFPYLETGSAVKKAIRKQQIQIDDKIGSTGDWVSAGNMISFKFSYLNSQKKASIAGIFYEDEDLIILRKPPGIATSGNSKSLQSKLELIEIEQSDGSLMYPYLVHRLDRATEGLMIAAKNIQTRRRLAEMFEQHEIIKRYILIVNGRLSPSLKWITESIDDKPAKTEILESTFLDTKDPTTRVMVQLHSGRTHQIRKHFSSLGHPIIGDQLYNKNGLTFGTGLLLCACYLEFIQPNTQKIIKINYPIPTKINKYKPIKNTNNTP